MEIYFCSWSTILPNGANGSYVLPHRTKNRKASLLRSHESNRKSASQPLRLTGEDVLPSDSCSVGLLGTRRGTACMTPGDRGRLEAALQGEKIELINMAASLCLVQRASSSRGMRTTPLQSPKPSMLLMLKGAETRFVRGPFH